MFLPAFSARAIALAVIVTFLVGIVIVVGAILAIWGLSALSSVSANLEEIAGNAFWPVLIAFGSIAIFVQFTACGYVAARFSKKDAVPNALLAAIIAIALSTVLDRPSMGKYWGLYGASSILSIGSAWFGSQIWIRTQARRSDV